MFTPLVAEYLFSPAVRLPKLMLARDVTGFVLVSLPVTLICTSATTVINATPVLLLVCAPVIPPLSNNIIKAVITTTTASKIVTVFVSSSTIVHLLLFILYYLLPYVTFLAYINIINLSIHLTFTHRSSPDHIRLSMTRGRPRRNAWNGGQKIARETIKQENATDNDGNNQDNNTKTP